MKSTPDAMQFGRFTLIPAERRLLDDGDPVALNARYLDALILLAGEPQAVITKERLHTEVWHGVAVTDEALTQCIRALRKALGDDAAAPTFIETVPKHGYRFIAPVERTARPARPTSVDSGAARRAGAMTLGGAKAGAIVGLLYGLVAIGGEGTALSLLIVVTCIAALTAGLSAMGIAWGITLGTALIGARVAETWRTLIGGAAGGFLTGGIANLLGRDAFRLLFGDAPRTMTGAAEGLALGLACGVSVALLDWRGRKIGLLAAGTVGGCAGAAVVLAGGTMMGGSLAALAETFPNSQVVLPLMGHDDRAPLAMIFGAIEGALFVTGVVLGAIRPSQWAAR